MMSIQPKICVSIDIGSHRHCVAVGLSSGRLLEEFEIAHTSSGFSSFFTKIQAHEKRHGFPVSIAMEGYNGHARPLDKMISHKDYRLFNVNNLKLARFKEIFPSAAKTDKLDARKGLELFQLRDHLPLAKDVLQEINPIPLVNDHLKRVTRRRRQLVNERVRVINSLQADLKATSPGLCDITQQINQVWYLNFLASSNGDLRKLAGKRKSSLMSISRLGKKLVQRILAWQPEACFSDDVELVSEFIVEDVQRIQALNHQIKQLERQIETLSLTSKEASVLQSLPRFGVISAGELAGEIGTIKSFEKESSLALYTGMAALDNSSGNYRGSKNPKQINRRAKSAMMIAIDKHRKYAEKSSIYYQKKRSEGKCHNQSIRALGRHLCRVIFKMLRDGKTYEEIMN